MKPCLNLILSQPDEAQEAFAERVERAIKLGFTQDEAKRSAAEQLLKDLDAEMAMAAAALEEQHPDLMGDRQGDQTQTSEFKRWFGDSKVVDDRGRPLVMYHGTGHDFSSFKIGTADAIFLSPTPQFANEFAMRGMGKSPSEYDQSMELDGLAPNVMPVYVAAKDIFDLDNADHRKELARELTEASYVEDDGDTFEAAMQGALQTIEQRAGDSDNWDFLEQTEIQSLIRSMGFDSFYVRENGVKNLGVYKSAQIKSAIGNNGQFDPANTDIRFSRRSGPEQYWIGNERAVPEHPAYEGVEDGTIAVMPELKVAGRSFPSMPIKVLVGDHKANGDARSKNFGLQHLVSNKLLKGRSFVSSTGDIAEDAARDIAATALSAGAAYSEGGNRVIFTSNLTKRALVVEVRRDAGAEHYSVVTLMPLSGTEQQKYGAPTLVRSGTVRTPLSGRPSTQGELDRMPLTSPTTQQGGPTVSIPLASAQLALELLKPGATPSRGLTTYIVDEAGQVARMPATKPEAAAQQSNPKWPDTKLFGLKPGKHIGGGVYEMKDGSRRYLDADGKPTESPVDRRLSRSAGRGFELPEFGRLADLQQSIQDRYNRWKQAVEAVREQGGTVTEANDFYREEERYWGKVGNQNDAFGEEIKAFVRAVQSDGLTLDDVATYVYARHAAERNAYVDTMRSDMRGAGSGMTDDDADAILDSARQSGLEPALIKHATTLYDWIDGTRDVMESNGLISQAERQAWESMFTNYVPLRGLEGRKPAKGTGSGFDIRGRESKTLAGRRSEAKQIIEQIIQDRTRAYIRAGKNEVLRSFLNFVLDNPSPNLWQVNRVETKPAVVVDAFGNRVVELRDTIVSDERTVAVKDAGQTIYIEIKDDVLREQMRNMHVENVGKAVGAMLWANRKVGAMLTSYNPAFVVMNGARDFQAATFGMLDEGGFKAAARFLREYLPAMYQAGKAQFGKPSQEYQQYLAAGGTTGYFGLKDLDDSADELRSILRNAERSPVNPIRMLKAVQAFVEKSNSVVEQATRFAAYRSAVRSGMTVARAASVSKNITVNFNRKGTATPQLSAVILFFNPMVQGSARIAQTLRSPKALGALAGATSALFFLAMRNAIVGGADDDDVLFWDKVPREVKERNIVIMLPPERTEDGKLKASYAKIPLAYGYNFFATLANEMADQWRAVGGKAPRTQAESAARVAASFLGATMPSAVSASVSDSSMLPMVVFSNAAGPVAQALLNKSSFGRPLYPDYPNEKGMPDSSKFSPSQQGTVFQKTAELLNRATGGDAYNSGFVDMAPGTIENAARFYGGGIASFSLDLLNAMYARQHIERPELDKRRLPFARQLYGVIDDETDRWFAYERMNKAQEAANPFSQAKQDGNGEAMRAILEDKGMLAASGPALQKIRASLSNLRKAELAVIGDDSLTDSEKYVKLVQLSSQVRAVLQQWNRIYNDLSERKLDD